MEVALVETIDEVAAECPQIAEVRSGPRPHRRAAAVPVVAAVVASLTPAARASRVDVISALAPLTEQRCAIGPGLCGFLTVLAPASGFQFASNLPLDGRLPSVSALAVGPHGEMYVAVPTTRGASIVRIDHLPTGLARRR